MLATPALFAARGGGGGGGGRGGAAPAKAPPAADGPVKDKYDKNHNGRLDKDELKELLSKEKALYDELMKFNANKDDTIDAGELTKWADSKKSKPAAGGAGSGAGGAGGGRPGG